MKRLTAAGLLLLLTACGSTATLEQEDRVAPAAAPVVTDPRVGELQTVVGELLDRIEVMNARIAKLESSPVAAQPAVRVADERATVQRPAPGATQPGASAEPAPTMERAAAAPRSPRNMSGAALAEAYRRALELYGKGRIDDSRRGFQEVFDADQSGDLADNALYWVGETYFSVGKYTEALRVYSRIITDYSDQNKAPDAMLKIGLVHAKLGDLALAKRTFEQLIARFPYSTPAAAAKYELNKIKY